MNRKVIILLILTIIWTGVIFVLSEMNSMNSNIKSKKIITEVINKYDQITNANGTIKAKHQSFHFIEKINHIFRKMCHASVFFVLAILVLMLLFQINKTKVLSWYLSTFIFCIVYAGADEYHQTLVTGRTGQISDALIDTVGILMGMLVFYLVYKVFSRRNLSNN